MYFDAPTCKGGPPDRLFLTGNYSSSAEFFVTIAVFSFLYSMAALSAYCFTLEKYRENNKGPQVVRLFLRSHLHSAKLSSLCHSRELNAGLVFVDWQDFVVTAVFAFMWLVSSCAWAKGLSDVKTATDPETVINYIPACDLQETRCKEIYDPKVSGLNTSVVGPAYFIAQHEL